MNAQIENQEIKNIEFFSLHSTYLGFAWTSEGSCDGTKGKMEYFVFRVSSFGLSTAGFIFSKVMRVVDAHWRSLSHKIVMFLDSGIGGDKFYQKALKMSNFVHDSLGDFGFLIAEDKCFGNQLSFVHG